MRFYEQSLILLFATTLLINSVNANASTTAGGTAYSPPSVQVMLPQVFVNEFDCYYAGNISVTWVEVFGNGGASTGGWQGIACNTGYLPTQSGQNTSLANGIGTGGGTTQYSVYCCATSVAYSPPYVPRR